MTDTTDDPTIEVVLALPQRCWRVRVTAPESTTAAEIVRRSGLDTVCERESGERPVIGVFGRKVGPDYVPRAGERLELYRSLVANPRERRRSRAGVRRRDDGGSCLRL